MVVWPVVNFWWIISKSSYNQTDIRKWVFHRCEHCASHSASQRTVSRNIFHHNLNLMENLFCNNYIHVQLITIKFCTCHNSTAVVSCAKISINHYIMLWLRARQISIEFQLDCNTLQWYMLLDGLWDRNAVNNKWHILILMLVTTIYHLVQYNNCTERSLCHEIYMVSS